MIQTQADRLEEAQLRAKYDTYCYTNRKKETTYVFTEEHRDKIGAALHQAYLEGRIKKQWHGFKFKMSRPEKKVLEVIQKYKLPWKYTAGKRGETVCGRRPDFMHKEKRVVLEVNGRYWHSKPEVVIADEKIKIKRENYGWKTVVLWDDEMTSETIILAALLLKTI